MTKHAIPAMKVEDEENKGVMVHMSSAAGLGR